MKSLQLHKCTKGKAIIILLASGFGLGLSPIASGTIGSLPGILLSIGIYHFWQNMLLHQVAMAIALALIAIPICDTAERHYGRKDDGRIVADEYLTFPLCMLGLPVEPWVLAMAFVANRCFDIIKPSPARNLQQLPGGLGIVSDDIASSLYCLLFNHIVYRLIVYYL